MALSANDVLKDRKPVSELVVGDLVIYLDKDKTSMMIVTKKSDSTIYVSPLEDDSMIPMKFDSTTGFQKRKYLKGAIISAKPKEIENFQKRSEIREIFSKIDFNMVKKKISLEDARRLKEICDSVLEKSKVK